MTKINLNIVEAIASGFHVNQKRDDGTPFIWHPQRVAQYVASTGADDSTVAIAWLHDTIEDTLATHENLESEFGTDIANSVQALSKPEGMDKEQWLVEGVSKWSDEELLVKQMDRLDNLVSAIGVWNPSRFQNYLWQTARFIREIRWQGRRTEPKLDTIYRALADVRGGRL